MAEHLETLVSAVSSALSIDAALVSSENSFLDLGGDSLAALYVAEELENLGLKLNPIDLLEDKTLWLTALGIRKS